MLGRGGGALGSFCAFWAITLVLAIAPFKEYGLGAYGFGPEGLLAVGAPGPTLPYTPLEKPGLSWGLEEAGGWLSAGSEELVLFNFPRVKPKPLFDLLFVRLFAAEGEGGVAVLFVKRGCEGVEEV